MQASGTSAQLVELVRDSTLYMEQVDKLRVKLVFKWKKRQEFYFVKESKLMYMKAKTTRTIS